jgi:hypothetical protein
MTTHRRACCGAAVSPAAHIDGLAGAIRSANCATLIRNRKTGGRRRTGGTDTVPHWAKKQPRFLNRLPSHRPAAISQPDGPSK